jgi:hypothetical protein
LWLSRHGRPGGQKLWWTRYRFHQI